MGIGSRAGVFGQGTEASISVCSLTEVYPPKLRSEEKRQRMTYANVDAYNSALAASGLLVPHGPMYLLDVHHLTQGVVRTAAVRAAPKGLCHDQHLGIAAGCGPRCTADGIHYSNATYDAALQIWGNNLRALPAAKG